MYRMYGAQLDDDTDDDKTSLNSSFWSDGEREEEEEEEEVERVISEGNFKPAEESQPKASGEAELTECSTSEQSSDDGDDDEERCSSSCDSPAPSLMTSGYGTYRPEDQEGGGDRDDCSDAAFGRDSRGDLSELRDEDGRSLCSLSFNGMDVEPADQEDEETRRPSVVADIQPEARVAAGGDDGLCEAADITHRTTEEEEEDGVSLGGGRVDAEEEKQSEEEEVRERPEEAGESDESSSNRDIKFIDSKVDFSLVTWEWEGNLRGRKGKLLPVGVARYLLQNFLSLVSKFFKLPKTFHHELESGSGS